MYDFTIYTQLSKTLGKVFFPSNNPALQALSFWGVFFIGYISRPAGAVLFGHLGDTRGRGTCLLLSVLVMGIPTVLIGCLPSYHQIGLAAPILLAALRLIQGLAMGGEFGAAMVYLHEIADARYKAVTGSLGYVSLGIGVVIGILTVVMVLSLVPADTSTVLDQLSTWVPGRQRLGTLQLLNVLSASATAAVMAARSPPCAPAALLMHYVQSSKQHAGLNPPACLESSPDLRCIDFRATSNVARCSHQHYSCLFPACPSPATFDNALLQTASVIKRALSSGRAPDEAADVAAKSDAGTSDIELQAGEQLEKHYVPILELFRGYWSGLVLQCGYEAWIGGSFYLGYSWLPSFFVQHAGISTMTSLWMVLTSMVLFTAIVPIAGYMSDKGQPRVTATIAICAIAAASSVPMFLAFRTGGLVACWLLQAFSLAMTAYTMGILPQICSLIYPAGVRISGFNLGYNLGMTIFGGLTPLAMTAIQTGTKSVFIGPALWMVGLALISIVCSSLLIKCYPVTNQRGSI
ncbi:major facilitator superfamily domain-containing protein [Scenedesmus sp. NREL 46B-D3]|nr:major facilitator superfamily domain-containing protein [Scenedesmus sp. NREL 46B-D3]